MPDDQSQAVEQVSGRPSLIVAIADPERSGELAAYLNRQEFTVAIATSVAECELWLARRGPDLVLLDAMLPGGDTVRFCQRLARSAGPPVIMLAAPDADPADCIVALELGAADYLFHDRPRRELLARIRAAIRTRSYDGGSRTACAAWRLDRDLRTVTAPNGSAVVLTRREIDLMRLFLERPNEVISRREAMVLCHDGESEASERITDVHVCRLRRKLSTIFPGPEIIRTVRGLGYAFVHNGAGL